MLSHGNPWLTLAADVSRLCLEAQDVVGLRMVSAMCGELDVRTEGWLMIAEKSQAAWDAQILISQSLLAGEAHLAPVRAVALYRSRVQANQRRLSNDRPD